MLPEPSEITPDWLLAGAERISLNAGPASGMEFGGLRFAAMSDPVWALAGLIGVGPHKEAMRRAVAGALRLHTLSPDDKFASRRVALFLVRMSASFASTEAAQILVSRLEQGSYRLGDARIGEEIAVFAAGQARDLRRRFEDGLRFAYGELQWSPSWAVPLLEADIIETPLLWISAAATRIEDLRALNAEGLNALQLLLRRLSAVSGLRAQIALGIGFGCGSAGEAVLDLVFDGAADFRLIRDYIRDSLGVPEIDRLQDPDIICVLAGRGSRIADEDWREARRAQLPWVRTANPALDSMVRGDEAARWGQVLLQKTVHWDNIDDDQRAALT